MIKINLSPSAKRDFLVDGPKLNLKEINLPLLLLALALSFVPDYIKTNNWDPEIKSLQNETAKLRKENRTYLSKINEMKQLRKEVEDFRKEETQLINYLKVVQEIVNAKKNPLNILKYISDNLPDDLWLNTIEIDGNNFKVVGEAYSYKSIGLFIESLKSSIFFDRNLRLVNSKTTQSQAGQKRVESFEIAASITRFE